MNSILESSLNDLYHNSVKAFPKTTKRQHSTQPIVIESIRWTPFVGVKTLFIKAIAQNEGKEYNSIILFKNVDYENKSSVKITASDGKEYNFGKLSLENTDVVLRCSCNDFRFRFSWYDHLDKSLYGRTPKKYESKGVLPPANPLKLPGMCKHLIKTTHVLEEAGIFK